MANRINNRRYNKLLSYRNNYFLDGGPTGITTGPIVASYLPGIGATYKNPQVTSTKTKGLFGNLGATIVDGFKSGALNGLASGLGNIVGGAIGGGMSSGVGSAMTSLSGLASAIPGPWGTVASAGLGVLGGLTNRMFGMLQWQTIWEQAVRQLWMSVQQHGIKHMVMQRNFPNK